MTATTDAPRSCGGCRFFVCGGTEGPGYGECKWGPPCHTSGGRWEFPSVWDRSGGCFRFEPKAWTPTEYNPEDNPR